MRTIALYTFAVEVVEVVYVVVGEFFGVMAVVEDGVLVAHYLPIDVRVDGFDRCEVVGEGFNGCPHFLFGGYAVGFGLFEEVEV